MNLKSLTCDILIKLGHRYNKQWCCHDNHHITSHVIMITSDVVLSGVVIATSDVAYAVNDVAMITSDNVIITVTLHQ